MADPYNILSWYWLVDDEWPASTNDSFCKVRLPLDGVDGGTTITDDNAGGSAHTWTAFGNAQLDTAVKKFGTASLLCDGTGDYVSHADHADFVLGASEFTIHGWFQVDDVSGNARRMAGQNDAGFTVGDTSFVISRTAGNVIQIVVSDGASLFNRDGTTQFTSTDNTGLHHFMVVRTGNVIRLFIDGIQEGADLAFTGTIPNSTSALSVGRAGVNSSDNWKGWIDHFEIDIGVARKTANFTPPAHPDGQAFKTAGAVDDFVSLSDSDYVAFLANGNIATPIATGTELWQVFDDYAQKAWVRRSFTQTSSSNITLTNPLASYNQISITGGTNHKLTLPKTRSPRAVPKGQTFLIENTSAGGLLDLDTEYIEVYAQDGTTKLTTILSGLTFAFTNRDNSSSNGTISAAQASNSRGGAAVVGLRGENFSGSTTLLTLGFNEASYHDELGVASVTLGGDRSANITTAGPIANGRDQAAAFSAGNRVSYYTIAGTTANHSLLISLTSPIDNSEPTLPTDYLYFSYMLSLVLQAGPTIPQIKVRGDTVFFNAAPVVLSNGTATTSTSVDVSAYVPNDAIDFTIDFRYAQVTADGSGNLIFDVTLEHVSGSVYEKRQWNFGGLAVSTAAAQPVGEVTFPNTSQAFRYFFTITAGSSPFLTGALVRYRVPNGA